MKKIAKTWITKMRWLPARLDFRLKGFGKSWRIFTHMTPEERLLLYHLARTQAPGTIFLEIGSYLGASSCFLAAAAHERGGVLHCVDTWFNEGMSEGQRDTWDEFCRNTAPFAAFIRTHRGLSTDIAVNFKDQIALLFVDGDHSYEACKADLEAWLPHIRENALLVMHDYGWAEGVKRVVDEIVKPRQKERGHVMLNTYWTRA